MNRHVQMVIIFIMVNGLAGCGGGGSTVPGGSSALNAYAAQANASSSTRSSYLAASRALSGASTSSYLAIDAGGAASGSWLADNGYSTSGFTGIETAFKQIDTAKVSNPAPQAVYRTQRYGTTLTYAIPQLAPNATYNVRLHFVESFFNAVGKRVFNVTINDTQELTDFDIYKVAGGSNIAIAKQFAAVADGNGKLTITLKASINNASVAGLEIIRVANNPPLSAVVSINAGGDALGSWIADSHYTVSGWNGVWGVTDAIDTSKVANPPPQSIYQSQRWAYSLGYTIPKLTPNEKYTVRLHFAETWWTAAGQRLFNVNINGVPVLTNFDIYRTAGGRDIAIIKEFQTQASPLGLIEIQMTGIVDNAAVGGVEILTNGSGGSPTPSPSAAPSAIPTVAGLPYIFAGTSAYSTAQGNGNPLFTPIAQLAKTQLSSTVVSNFWRPGLASGDSALNANGPVYVVSSTINSDAPELTFEANGYGSNRFSGTKVHVPRWAVNQCGNISEVTSGNSDCHMEIIDYINGVEVSGWQCVNGGAGGTFNGSSEPGRLYCYWGGASPIGGTGLRSDGYDASHGGFSEGAVDVTPQEIMNAEHGIPIKHAFMVGTQCLNNPTVYPADTSNGSDSTCSNDTSGSVYPAYGDLVELVPNPSVPIANHSAACQAILQAMQTYGAYLGDTGGQIQMLSFSDFVYSKDPANPVDPWKTVLNQMISGGDASGWYNTGGNASGWSSCLQGLRSSDFEMFKVSKS